LARAAVGARREARAANAGAPDFREVRKCIGISGEEADR
jgi:hypothetical protein